MDWFDGNLAARRGDGERVEDRERSEGRSVMGRIEVKLASRANDIISLERELTFPWSFRAGNLTDTL